MATCQLGAYSFRIAPSQVFFTYEVDTAVIPTVGGRVVQAFGVTLGDVTVRGLFGQNRAANRDSWEMAEEFQAAMGTLVKAQSKVPTGLQIQGRDPTPMHQPVRFLFNDDSPERRAAGLPVHNWDLQVYVKALSDVSGNATIEHATGKYSYGYTLTLFIVEDNSRTLKEAAVNKFIDRLATGVGWQRTRYNGPMDKAELQEYLQANSPEDPTIHGLMLKEFNEAAEGTYFSAGSGDGTTPGGAATANDAQNALGTAPSTGTTPAARGTRGGGGTF